MSRDAQIALLAVLGIGAYLAMSAIYTVSEVEQMIITPFGKPVGDPVTSAGLKFKLPFIQDVNPIDKRVLEWDGSPSDMPTKDRLYISVDLFARWRITDPLQYFLRLRDERSAPSRLDDILGSETRNAVAKYELIEVIRTTKDRVPLRDALLTDAEKELNMGSLVPIQKGRQLVEQEIFAAAAEKVRVFGIELLDIRFKRINYNESVRPKICDRMISERRQIAERFLSEGNGEAARIRGNRVRDLNKIQSEAYRQVEEIRGVVGKFVEFYGEGMSELPLADRATIANMAPEYGATCGIFPFDHETLRYLALTGRPKQQLALVEAYARCQVLFHDKGDEKAGYTDLLELDLKDVEPSLAGPTRPQDRIGLNQAKQIIGRHLHTLQNDRSGRTPKDGDAARFADEDGGTAVGGEESAHSGSVSVEHDGKSYDLKDGAVVIAAITSCTNTSNPQVMVGAGLLARNAKAYGLEVKPWVKTSLAPGSKVVKDYLEKAELLTPLESLGFHLVGYGCTTCIGNSGPLPEHIGKAVREGNLIVSAILSGNRHLEGRIHADVKMNFLASPPLVVAHALAETTDIDLQNEPLGADKDGIDIYLRDVWPSAGEIQEAIVESVRSGMFLSNDENVFEGDERWNGMALLLGDSITTDHISPAGAIEPDSPAGVYLQEHQVPPNEFNAYGSRRGNHEVMMRGTFANVRLRKHMAPGTEGGWTTHQPSGEQMTIFEAAMRYEEEGVPLVILGGSEYGTGSSRDWAAKGPLLLGVIVVIAKSFERIHRSNLVGMGVLPLTFEDGEDAEVLGLTGVETFDIEGLERGAKKVQVVARCPNGSETRFTARARIDTPKEEEYFAHGGILHYVIRQLAA